MNELPVDLDRNPAWIPSLGQWRVIEREEWDSTRAQIVGDYPTLSLAMEEVKRARYPHTRTVINDLGVAVAGFTPASAGAPDAGGES
jgi:hypothetical protein